MSSTIHGCECQTLNHHIEEHTNVSVADCYQCGKCSAGCPLAEEMDYPPSQILRMLQRGTPALEEKVLRSMSIWLCLTCETCIARCPQEVDFPKVMDYLRGEALRRGIANPKAKDIIAFHKAFLDSIQATGRLYEMGLIVDYKARSRHLLQDILIAPWMFMAGKLHIIPEMIKGKSQMSKIFSGTLKKKKEEAR
ncbi:MAG: 4Fe-4S dicluster domain-containing protein [Acidobacteria bacterium]|jgi:heterodisulfide reductase subunit C|nr:4Fe-4S dicluster domain-containing protein [Acidobacteriota bacterium]